jgi:hypothetical protein
LSNSQDPTGHQALTTILAAWPSCSHAVTAMGPQDTRDGVEQAPF